MDLDQDNNQHDAPILPYATTLVQASINEVAADPVAKKLTLEERLSRLSKYRIRTASIRSTAKPNGKGGKGDVVRASFKRNKGARGKRVAVRKLRWSDSTEEEKFSKEFVHEVELLAGLSHENIVQLIGFVEDLKHQKAWIVLSWEPNGNVREFLASGKWEIPERISLIQDMFKGLKYLHTRQPPICHGDLKSLNILVSSSYRAIITDFGSARVLRNEVTREEDQSTAQRAGRITTVDEEDSHPEITVVASANQLTLTGPIWTLRWAAPELFNEEGKRPGLASDIWSAGWVCWEMMTDRVPFEDLKRDCAIMLKVIQGELPLIHEDADVGQVTRLCSLMTDCWRYKLEDRPHVDQCCKELKWMPSVPPLGGTSSGDKELSATLLLKMGRMHHSQDRHEKALTLFEKVVTSAESAVHPAVVAEALRALGNVHYAQCRDKEAEGCYARAQEIYARIGDDKGLAKTFNGIGEVYRAQCKHAEALESYTRAQEIYARIGDDHGRANTLTGLGHLYRAQCKYAEAEESYTRAQEIYARVGEEQGRANTLNGLGDVYQAQCKYARAKESYTWAQETYTRIGNEQGRANTLDGLGDVYQAQCKYAEAEESYTRAQEIYARIGDEQGRANAILGLGHVSRAQCKYPEAEEWYKRAQEIYARLSDHQGRANALRGFGHLYREQGRRMEAAQFYAQARDLYSQVGDPDDEHDASHWLDTVLDKGHVAP